MHITVNEIKNDPKIAALINSANRMLEAIGYTEHGPRHVGFVSATAQRILRELGFPERDCELAAIAGWVHDVGNAINRLNHGISGGLLLFPLLLEAGLPIEEVMAIVGAVGNHEEQNGKVISALSAALVIADKADAHRTRVRRAHYDASDIHDRVNYSIGSNQVEVDAEKNEIRIRILMDETSSVMDFLEIYLSRMLMCEEAASFLNCRFQLVVNGVLINRQGQKKAEA
ncbi:MAG: HD domain-containing protein [Christensenellaceae bacterium]|jgi:metal-dependent HD superfamily phosphatase/phosphodiesterase|nr:HD domain-containing protein [Christensenellaceae bacterium]